MKTTTRIAIASLLSAAGSLLNAFASEFGEGVSETSTAATPEAPKRGRKPAAATVVETVPTETGLTAQAEPAAVAPEKPTETPATTVPAGDITNPKYQEHRALINPLVTGDQSTAELRAEVKKIVEKYSPNGGLKVMAEKHHAAFEKDIAALSY